MIRLSAEEFLSKLKMAPGWTIKRDTMTGEIELTTKEHLNASAEMFYGPNPLDMDILEYSQFLKKIAIFTSGAAQ